jgi:ankyrin repeat protein
MDSTGCRQNKNAINLAGFAFATTILLGCTGGKADKMDLVLVAAIKANNVAVIREIGGSENRDMLNKPSHDKTPLEYAYSQKCKEAYLALLEYGADPNQFLADQQTITFIVAMDEDSYWLSKALEHGGSPDLITKAQHRIRGTPLQISLHLQINENARLLIDAGADLNQPIRPAPMNFTALDIAASKRNWDMAKYLLQKGADPHRCCESSVFMFRLKNPDVLEFNSQSFADIVAILESQRMDISKSVWNDQTWEIPGTR